MKQRFLWLCVGLVFIAAAGCAHRPRHAPGAAPPSDLLFGPAYMTYAGRDMPRSSWPETGALDTFGEDITYRETVIDWQGRFQFGRNDYYRRFESVREGRGRR